MMDAPCADGPGARQARNEPAAHARGRLLPELMSGHLDVGRCPPPEEVAA